MPQQIYTVEIDGMQYDLEGDHPPSEAEARAAVGGGIAPNNPAVPTSPPVANAKMEAGRQGELARTDLPPDIRSELEGLGTRPKGGLNAGPLLPAAGAAIGSLVGPLTAGAGAALGTGAESLAKGERPNLGQMALTGGLTAGVGKLPAAGRLIGRMLPNAARAGASIEAATQAAGSAPVDISATGQAGLRAMELAERGGQQPRVVGQLMRRITDPAKPPLGFEEARDFYSNLSRLSADEFNRLTPVMKRQIGELRSALSDALQATATQVGKGAEYAGGMKEYANAAKLSKFGETAKDIAIKKVLPAGAAYEIYRHFAD